MVTTTRTRISTTTTTVDAASPGRPSTTRTRGLSRTSMEVLAKSRHSSSSSSLVEDEDEVMNEPDTVTTTTTTTPPVAGVENHAHPPPPPRLSRPPSPSRSPVMAEGDSSSSSVDALSTLSPMTTSTSDSGLAIPGHGHSSATTMATSSTTHGLDHHLPSSTTVTPGATTAPLSIATTTTTTPQISSTTLLPMDHSLRSDPPGPSSLSSSTSMPGSNSPSVPTTASSTTTTAASATTFSDLHLKYAGELLYMLREFTKLERQLLGGGAAAAAAAASHPGGASHTTTTTTGNAVVDANSTAVEPAGSRERREKLQSFIQHLKETLEQLERGCNSATTDPTTTLSVAETVAALEEHIQSSLLPVKIRLQKQLAAQQGLQRNPVHMPANHHRSVVAATLNNGTTTTGGGMGAHGQTCSVSTTELSAKPTFAATSGGAPPALTPAPLVTTSSSTHGYDLDSVPVHVATNLPPAKPVAPNETLFGRPLVNGGGGSRLTKKIHGAVLGGGVVKKVPPPPGLSIHLPVATTTNATNTAPSAVSRKRGVDDAHDDHDHERDTRAVTGDVPTTIRKVYKAGMAGDVAQIQSSLSVATSVHRMQIRDPVMLHAQSLRDPPAATDPSRPLSPTPIKTEPVVVKTTAPVPNAGAPLEVPRSTPTAATMTSTPPPVALVTVSAAAIAAAEQQHRRRKRRRKQMQQKQDCGGSDSHGMVVDRKTRRSSKCKNTGWQRKPRTVEYICSLCSETYQSTCIDNPWWSLQQQDCLKCEKRQIPRIDISAPANAIEYHPALLAHADDQASDGKDARVKSIAKMEDSESEFSDDGNMHVDDDEDSALDDCYDSISESDDSIPPGALLTVEELAEWEKFGADYTGPVLDDEEACRLLILMSHASTCPGRHKCQNHQEVCRGTKWMMLHVRDCPGTTASFDVCPFPWCRKVKHLLYHLVTCDGPKECQICHPPSLGRNWVRLQGLNTFRLSQFREHLLAERHRVLTVRLMELMAKEADEEKKGIEREAATHAKCDLSTELSCKETTAATLASTSEGTSLSATVTVDNKPSERDITDTEASSSKIMLTKTPLPPMMRGSSDHSTVVSSSTPGLLTANLGESGAEASHIESDNSPLSSSSAMNVDLLDAEDVENPIGEPINTENVMSSLLTDNDASNTTSEALISDDEPIADSAALRVEVD